jgi:hypothetical protein
MKNIIREELLLKVLLEGRLEDIIKKYANNQDDVEDVIYFSKNDPSGNNKYLKWMTTQWLESVSGVGAGNKGDIVLVVKSFHENLQRINNKDINSYKSFGELRDVTDEAEEKKKEAEEKKAVKNQKEVIYSDDDWLVVSPLSWKASCYYGAGTKWCVASKQTDTHWKSYNKRSTFFYVIDKNKNQKDPLYKVAYRMLKDNKWEFWDAEDLEFSKQERGQTWFEGLPKKLVDNVNQYHMNNYPSRPAGAEWIDEDSGAQALENLLGHSNISAVNNDLWYSLKIYLDEDENKYYAVGDEDDVMSAVADYYEMMEESEIIQRWDLNSLESYITMDDPTSYAENEAEYMVANFDDREICLEQGRVLEYDNLESDIGDLESEIDNLESDQRQYAETDEEIEEIDEQIDVLTIERDEKEGELEQLIEECKTDYIANETYKIEEEIGLHGPVDYFINERSHFMDVNQMMASGGFSFDKDEWISNDILQQPTGDIVHSIFEGDFDTDVDDDGGEHYLGKINY